MTRKKLIVSGVLILVTFALYWPSRTHDLICFDDPMFIVNNEQIKSGLSWKSFRYAFTDSIIGNWHPVTTLSHMLDCQLFGSNPGPHHLVSAGIHAINAALLFLALTQLTGSLWRSAVVAALFAWHPLRVESVAWIAERKDVLSGFFFFLMLWAYARYAETKRLNRLNKGEADRARESEASQFEIGNPNFEANSKSEAPNQNSEFINPKWPRHLLSSIFYLLALVALALGLMSKPMLVTAPFVLILLDIWPLRRVSFASTGAALKDLGRILIEKVPHLILAGVISFITMQLQKGVAEANAAIAFEDRVMNAVVSYTRYLGKFFCPVRLAIIYPHLATSKPEFDYWDGWRVFAAAAMLLTISVACVLLLKRMPWLFVGWSWFIGTLIPVIGLVQVGVQSMADRYTYIPMVGVVIALVWVAAEVWRPNRFRNWVLTAVAAMASATCLVLTHHQLGYWKDSVTLFTHNVAVTSNNSAAEVSLGLGYERAGRAEEAMSHYEKGLALNPSDEQAHYEMGQLLRKRGDWERALAEYSTALGLNPNNVDTCLNLGLVLEHLRRYSEAIDIYGKALRLQPTSTEALNNLAWILATSEDPSVRNGAKAVELARRACEITGYKQTTFIGTLAAAYAEAADFKSAVQTAEKACAVAEKNGDTDLLATNKELLQLYRSGKPYRQSPQ